MDIKELQKKLDRVNRKIRKLEETHLGNENKFTYHGGFDMGYLKGKRAVLEDIIDSIKDKV
jgi:hypothetical protein